MFLQILRGLWKAAINAPLLFFIGLWQPQIVEDLKVQHRRRRREEHLHDGLFKI